MSEGNPRSPGIIAPGQLRPPVILAGPRTEALGRTSRQNTICDFFRHTSGICRSPYYSRKPEARPALRPASARETGTARSAAPIWLIFYYPAGLDFHKKLCYNIKKRLFQGRTPCSARSVSDRGRRKVLLLIKTTKPANKSAYRQFHHKIRLLDLRYNLSRTFYRSYIKI